ncbi:hypothetical protein [Desulfobulbus oligotrophicus]|jgi:hypothetical protein|uniref:Uncharacterized protein n=1 Tax=Desulfobulbus oligotrophicus TaxID=1909699 RepID=A0A7T5VFF9_9BACT|nr:hypothetical protein [Desulfobulbus oligotrophicus]MDY0389963.1 hypothetical protein [Desulfobulbus oligotrophicus]QQG66782.1 hypothetical protein HP555_13370 [Desulfobulbus oligotrophicus]
MGLLPITEKGKPVTCQVDWPLFYMNDFSRMGIVVTRLDDAVIALKNSGCAIHENEQGCFLDISGEKQLHQAVQALSACHLEYEMADLVSCAYQG